MTLIVISVDENELPEHTKEDFEIWIKYCVGEKWAISEKNPLCECDLEATVKEIG